MCKVNGKPPNQPIGQHFCCLLHHRAEACTIPELYDIVYRLDFTDDGKKLLCLQIPHLKMQNTTSERQMYINVVDMETGQPKRRGFTSKAHYEPDFKLSHNGKMFGVVSRA